MLSKRLITIVASAIFLASPISAARAAPPEVDVALVLAVDISYSMDPDELELQRQGYVQAMRSPEFEKAVKEGVHGRVAIAYLEWAGPQSQYVLAPFTIIDNAENIAEFAATIQKAPTRRAYRTSISAAIDTAVKMFDDSGIPALRQVIDISGDGPNNQGRRVTEARDEALSKGIAINGLPILLKRGGYMDIDDLDLYYTDCVIGGPGAFVIPIRSREQFTQAIRTKLVQEVAGRFPARPLIDFAQASPAPARPTCTTGERQWQQRIDN